MADADAEEKNAPSPAAQEEEEQEEAIADAVPFTCRMTAAFRAIEAEHAAPIIRDPLALSLAGAKALAIARRDVEQLVQLQGPGRHLRVPARNRIVDDLLLAALERVGGDDGRRVQVVNLGAGMVRAL